MDKYENKVPIGMIMDMAKQDISFMVNEIIQKNHIPPDLMVYILESVLYEVERARGMSEANRNVKISESDQKGDVE